MNLRIHTVGFAALVGAAGVLFLSVLASAQSLPSHLPPAAESRMRGELSRDRAPLPTPRPEIHLDGHIVTGAERAAVARRSDGTPTKLASTLAATQARLGVRAGQRDVDVVRLRSMRVAGAKAAIERLGGEVVGYAPDAALLVRLDPAAVDAVAALPDVEWIGAYQPEYRISPELQSKLDALRAGAPAPAAAQAPGAALPAPPAQAGRVAPTRGPRADSAAGFGSGAGPVSAAAAASPLAPLDVNIYLFAGETPDRVLATVAALGGQAQAPVRQGEAPKIRASLPAAALTQLTLLPEIRLIESYAPNEVTNDKATAVIHATDTWNTLGLTGAGQIIGHADTGLDVGSTSTINADFQGRIATVYALGRPGDWSDTHGHGTHTAGSILGSGANSGGAIKGSAPGASLVHQALEDAQGNLSGIPGDLGVLFQQAYNAGARVHSDSWGANTAGGYSDSVYLDAWSWNSGHPRNMLIVVAAGNAGSAAQTVGAPGTAKNALVIGASENNRPALGSLADNVNDIASFSSRGPTSDGRIKPDLVAPGTWVASVKSHGLVIPFHDDFEQGPLGWTLSPANANFALSNSTYHSPSTSYHYQSTGIHDDYLIAPAITVPSTAPLYVRCWVGGTIGSGTQLGIAYRTGSGPWTYPSSYISGPGTLNNNYILYWAVPASLAGQTLQFAVNAYCYQSGSSANFNVDDFAVTSFLSWGDMFEQGLAAYGDSVDQNYTLDGGTSMATPLAAGAAALVRQYFTQLRALTPSAELVKAMLINGADTPTGSPARPTNNFGWGRIDLKNSLFPDAPRTFVFDQDSSLSETAQKTYDLLVTSTTPTLSATLVWADHDGSTLQNDLDMSLLGPDSVTRLPLGTGDHINNVEGVDVTSPPAGIWHLTVKGKTVPYGPQPFALVVSGAVAFPETLAVVSSYGSPSPSGTAIYAKGTAISATVDATVLSAPDTRRIATGWQMAFADGSTSQGLGNAITFALDQSTTLTWQWKTQYALTATASPALGGSAVPASAWIDDGATTNVLATAATGWNFTHWSGDAGGSTNPLPLTIHAPTSLTANFATDDYLLSVGTAHGSVARSPDQTVYADGSSVTLTESPDVGYSFAGWSGDVPPGHAMDPALSLTMDSTKTLTAIFAINTYSLAAGGVHGSVTPSPNLGAYPYGTTVTLTATPDAGYSFAGWSGDAPGGHESDNPLLLGMDANKSLTAAFTIDAYTLTTGAAQGTVGRSPDAASYDYGSVVSLTATPATGYHFTGWSGDVPPGHAADNPLSVTIDAAKSVTAGFAINSYALSISAAPGTVSRMPNLASYNHGTTVTLTPVPPTGYHFTAWSGDEPPGHTGDNPLILTMDAAKSLTAGFAINTYTLGTSGSNVTIGISPNAATYNHGTTVTLTATPAAGYHFVNWTGTIGSALNPLVVTMTQNYSLTAQTARDLGTVSVAVTPTSGTWTLIDGGGATHDGMGTATLNALPGGTLSLTWHPLLDHDEPAPNPTTSTLIDGGHVTFSGVYTPHLIPGLLNYLLGIEPYHAIFDVNQDGRVDIADLILIHPPGVAGSPAPDDGATTATTATALDWSAGPQATSYDLYLWPASATQPTSPTAAGLTATHYQPSAALDPATAYAWLVVARNDYGATTGTLWRFTTLP